MGTSNEAPVVELVDPYDDDYYVGPPPGAHGQNGQPSYKTKAGPTTRRSSASQRTVPNTLESFENSCPLNTEPVNYTPKHPSQIPEPLRINDPNPPRRGIRRTHNGNTLVEPPPATRLTQNVTPRICPPVTTTTTTRNDHLQPSRFALQLPNQPRAITSQPSILRPQITRPPYATNNIPLQHASSSNPNPWPVRPPKFGGPPNFQNAFGTTPSSSFVSWQHGNHYMNTVPPSYPNNVRAQMTTTPAPAHSRIGNANPTPSAHSNLAPPQLRKTNGKPFPAHSSSASANNLLSNTYVPPGQMAPNDFVSQAAPVRPAYEDFLRHVQNAIPGVNVTEVLQQINSNPTQPIQIPVPNGYNNASVQQKLQHSLETSMLQLLNNAAGTSQPLPTMQDTRPFNSAQHFEQFPGADGGFAGTSAEGPINMRPTSEDEIAKQDLDAGANHDEEYHEVETYSDYVPAKLKLGLPHPDPVVETSSLSTVEPPDVFYDLKLPARVIDNGLLSALQLESVIYACQQHTLLLADNVTRRGFLIGDGAGVGKGRTIAGIIYENYLRGRKKSIWLSVSTDLKLDAERDLKDIGAKIPVSLLGKFQYGRRIDVDSGVIFTTYSGLVSKSQSVRGALGNRLGQLVSWAGANFDGIIVFDECHKAKNISMTKNKKQQSKAAEFALEIQKKLPKARVVYASATGASETKHLGYMTRLGMWGVGTPYETFMDFRNAIDKRGVGAMELVAVDLKTRGSYIARQLSFKTTTFEIRIARLEDSFIKVYDQCVDMWAKAFKLFTEAADFYSGDKKRTRTIWPSFWAAHQKFFKYLCIGAKVSLVIEIAKAALKDGKCVVIGLQSTGETKTMEALEDGDINEFISTARATFESLVENHFPAPYTPKRSRGKATTSSSSEYESTTTTTESTTSSDYKTSSSSPSSSSSSTYVQSDSSNYQPPSDSSSSTIIDDSWRRNEKVKRPYTLESDSDSDDVQITAVHSKPKRNYEVIILSSDDEDEEELDAEDPLKKHGKRLTAMKEELLNLIDKVGPSLPNNTLDDLIDRLGGPNKVAEMTGRKGRVVKDRHGKVSYKTRNEVDALENLNILEKERFMDGEKLIAIISEAASSGISLQADKRVENQRRRVHITIELPWSADRAIQQFGRTHRSNQVCGPEYVFVISELAGERRFASIVAKRLESLGALTHGDRRATSDSRDLSQFNLYSRYCHQALEILFYYVATKVNRIDIQPEYPNAEKFIKDAREAFAGVGIGEFSGHTYCLPYSTIDVTVFLNRLLGMKVGVQNAVFKLFTDYMDRLIARKKVSGQHDAGILELNSESGQTRCDRPEDFFLKTKSGAVKCTLRNVQVERGINWEEALKLFENETDKRSGFYVSTNPLTQAEMVYLLIREPESLDLFRVYKPNTGRQPKPDFYDTLTEKGHKAQLEKAERIWRSIFDLTDKFCIHICFFRSCKRLESKQRCDVGLRHRNYCILSGGILTAWPYLEKKLPDATKKLQIVRLRLDATDRVIGPIIPQHYLDAVRKHLRTAERDGVDF